MIEEGLRTLLINDGTIAALIGTRAYGKNLPQKPTLPAIVMTRVSTFTDYVTTSPSGLAEPGFQIDCYAETLAGARGLAVAIRNKLSGYKGTAGNETIQGAFLTNDQDMPYDSVLKTHRVLMDFSVWYNE